jgi:hypothetical protein
MTAASTLGARGAPTTRGAIVDSTSVRAKAVVGVRKKGADAAATVDDLWHTS